MLGIELAREVKSKLEAAEDFRKNWREQHERWVDAKPTFDAMRREATDLMPPLRDVDMRSTFR